MDKNKAALGTAPVDAASTCLIVDTDELDAAERIFVLEEQMKHMQRVLTKLRKNRSSSSIPLTITQSNEELNKDGIPIGTVCYGSTEKSLFLYYLTVEAEGYVVGSHFFPSLSAAAEAVSKVRRSGWTFWRMIKDGLTLKEMYKE